MKKTWIKIGIVLMIAGMTCFSDFSFAADSSESIRNIGNLLNLIVGVLSWIWIFFAKLAGWFLTNEWVYGEFIGLDSLLRKWWSIIRNIANFGLGFYFVYVIFSAVIGKDDITKKVKDVLLWILIAGVGIQASRFFTAAMVDVSTVTMVAAGSLPSQIISKNSDMQTYIHTSLSNYVDQRFMVTTGVEYTLFPTGRGNGVFLERISVPVVGDDSKSAQEKFIDMLMPNGDDVSGPLYYIGFAILDANANTLKASDNVIKTILNCIIVGGTTIIYSIEMLVFCVLALMRIVYLRMFIVLSPLAVLLRCIGKSDKNLGDKIGGFVKSITKHINFKSFFLNIFKPTIIVLGMGIALMFSMLMSQNVGNNGRELNKDLGGMNISSHKNSSDTYDTTISSDFFKYSLKNVAKSLLEMLVSIITVILVYFVIKSALEIGKSEDFVSKDIKSFQDSVQKAMTSIPIVPVSGYDKNGVQNPNAALSRNALKQLPTGKLNQMTAKAELETSTQSDNVLKGWGLIDDNGLTSVHKTEISNAGLDKTGLESLRQKLKYINNIKTEKGRGMTLDPKAPDPFWRQEFEGWLERANGSNFSGDSAKVWENMVNWWNNPENKDTRTLEKLFNVDGSVQAYANLFNLGALSSWEALKGKDISSENDTNGNKNS